jgi:DNA-binding MarR family transcriptional regulator
MHVENSTVTGLIDRLEKKGFVERVVVENDRRKWNIAITISGRREIERAERVIHAINAEIADGMSKNELAAFKKALNGFFAKFGGRP